MDFCRFSRWERIFTGRYIGRGGRRDGIRVYYSTLFKNGLHIVNYFSVYIVNSHYHFFMLVLKFY